MSDGNTMWMLQLDKVDSQSNIRLIQDYSYHALIQLWWEGKEMKDESWHYLISSTLMDLMWQRMF
jgi:hypothetical protein